MSLASLLSQTATIYDITGTNEYGRLTIASSGTLVPCRFERKTRTIKNKTGQEVTLMGRIFLKGNTTVKTGCKIEIGVEAFRVFSIDSDIDGKGTQQVLECEVEKWQATT